MRVLSGDGLNVALLVLLYCCQGVPLGLVGGAIPFLLKSNQQVSVSYSALGMFSMATLPFSLKLLWSPIVDTVYSRALGRRRSWIVPLQLLSGFSMIAFSGWIDQMIARAEMVPLSVIFFVLVFCFATEDVAVDGWALEMLQPSNLSWAATAQSLGQNLGYFAGFGGVIALKSLMSVGTHLLLWGLLYVAVALGIFFFRPESPISDQRIMVDNLPNAYRRMIRIVSLPAVQKLAFFYLTFRIFTTAHDRVLALKILELGASETYLASLSALAMPLSMVVSVVAGGWARSNALSGPVWWGSIARLALSACGWLVFHFYSSSFLMNALVAVLLLSTSTLSTLVWVSMCSHNNVVSSTEPSLSGSYLTLLNTMGNLGSGIPVPLVMWLVDYLHMPALVDGFTMVTCVSCIAGAAYFTAVRPMLHQMDSYGNHYWCIPKGVEV